MIEAKSKSKLRVVFKSKKSSPVLCKILLADNRVEGTETAAAMVFSLKSNITGRIPKDSGIIMKTHLYIKTTQEIKIENHFEKDANFDLIIESKD